MAEDEFRFLRKKANWRALHFYQKAEALYQLTYAFQRRFLKKGDCTIDQMVQAARSCTQNIIEGSEDGLTSTEMEVKLMNVARSSMQELQNDYEQYLVTRQLTKWEPGHPRYQAMVDYCRNRNAVGCYEPYFNTMSDEELANTALTLCHFIDKMMTNHINRLEHNFVEEGGIKERMTAARLGRRQTQNEEIKALKARVAELEGKLRKWQEWYRENYRKPSDTLGNPRIT